jgi:hypothetical protein
MTSMKSSFLHPFIAWFLLGVACHPPAKDTEDSAEDRPSGFLLGPPKSCDLRSQLSFDRFSNEAEERGLSQAINPDLAQHAGVLHTAFVAEDLDDDGDIDLAFNRPNAMPMVYENNGQAEFNRVEQISLTNELGEGRKILNVAAADLNGDTLPDLVLSGSGLVMVAFNQGGLHFDAPQDWFRIESQPYTSFQSFHLGDVDGDEDLDILLAGTALIDGSNQNGEDTQAGPELLLLNTGEGFALEATLNPAGGAGFSLLSLMTDYDNDGDLDLQTFTDLGRRTPSNFYRNDGLNSDGSLALVEEANALHADLRLSAMGITTGDYNRDGQLDYCMSDIGPAKCLLSAPDGSFVESGVAMGLAADLMVDQESWAGWSMEIEDLDNDGLEDAISAAGLDMRGILPPDQPDAIWQGIAPGKFKDQSIATGFADDRSHYALATADFDGDGFLDILTLGANDAPVLWMNQCDNQAWLEVEVYGPPLNRSGFGVRVQLQAGGQTQLRELQNLRGLAQAPSRLHFGLGNTERVERLTLLWPDGSTDVLEDFSPNRLIQFHVENRP